MGMGDSHIFQRWVGYRCSVLWVFRQCKIEPCKPYICMLWTPLPKHWPTQTRMGFGRNGVMRMQWSNARRCSRIALDRNGYWKETSNPASILHVDASFKNPYDLPEEQHRPLPGWRGRTAYRHVVHMSLCSLQNIIYAIL